MEPLWTSLKGHNRRLQTGDTFSKQGKHFPKREEWAFYDTHSDGRNVGWTRARSTLGHFPIALAPALTSSAAWVKVKCAETEGCRRNSKRTGTERRRDKGKVWRLRESSLIRFLGRMTKLCGMQLRREREVIKSSRTRRGGGNRRQTRRERGLLNKPGWQGLPLIHFPFPSPFSFSLSLPLFL